MLIWILLLEALFTALTDLSCLAFKHRVLTLCPLWQSLLFIYAWFYAAVTKGYTAEHTITSKATINATARSLLRDTEPMVLGNLGMSLLGEIGMSMCMVLPPF